MRLCCHKCKKTLTTDLRHVSVKYGKEGRLTDKSSSDVYEPRPDFIDPEDYHTAKIKSGLFFMSKEIPKHNWTVCDMYDVDSKRELQDVDPRSLSYHRVYKKIPQQIVVGEFSILKNVIPEYVTGCGCCNWADGQDLVCSCGVILGEMHLDCYENGSVYFHTNEVDRVYK